MQLVTKDIPKFSNASVSKVYVRNILLNQPSTNISIIHQKSKSPDSEKGSIHKVEDVPLSSLGKRTKQSLMEEELHLCKELLKMKKKQQPQYTIERS